MAQTCTFVGTPWNLIISTADVTDAGLDVTSEYFSAPNQSEFNLYYPSGNNNFKYEVEVRKSDINWPVGVELAIRRTGDGSQYVSGGPPGQNRIDGGETWITLSATDQAFFDGRGGRINVPIQYSLNNISVIIPADSYSTEVIYTISVK